MGGTHRTAQRALLVVLGVAAALLPPSAKARAQSFPFGQSLEPPLVGAPPTAGAAPIADPADPPTPWVSVHVRAPATGQAGQEVDYRILVENRSQTSAHHVFVRVAAPANAAYVRASPDPTAHEPQVVWDLATLAPATSKELLLTLKPNGAGDVEVIARVQFEHGQSVRTRIGAGTAPPVVPAAPSPPPVAAVEPPPPAAPKAALRLRKTGPAQATRYDAITFQLEVTNTGTAEARQVELTDSLPPGLSYKPATETDPGGNILTWNVGALAPGQTRRVQYDAIALEIGDHENAAQAKADGGLRETSSWRVHVNEPKLAVAVVGPQKRLLGRPAKYQITVTNSGATALTGIEIRDELPEGVHFVGASDNGRQEGNRIHWILGSAPPGGWKTVTVELSAAKETEAVFHVTAVAARGLTASADAKTHFEGATGLHVEIDKSEDPLPVGHEADYTIRILNRGAAPAKNVRLTVTAPEQMQMVSKETPADATLVGRALAFNALPTIEAGKEAVFKLHVKALRAGEVKMIVEVRSDDLTAPLHEEETTTLFGEAPSPPPPVSP
jgi:uncharacterized repeat protein (TIGR01451 family)